jgi:hypothetical protein
VGKEQVNVKENQSKNEFFPVFCDHCHTETEHIVRLSVDREVLGTEFVKAGYSYEPSDVLTLNISDRYQIIQCQGCKSISFRHVKSNSDDNKACVSLYPHRSEITREMKDYYHLPKNIEKIYRETISCFNNQNLILCAAGLRAIVEGICADKNIEGGSVQEKEKDGTLKTNEDGSAKMKYSKNLDGKIAGLAEGGIVTPDQTSILHAHRFLGNDALHELQLARSNVKSICEIKLAIEVVEGVLDIIYEVPEKEKALKNLREDRKKVRNREKG